MRRMPVLALVPLLLAGVIAVLAISWPVLSQTIISKTYQAQGQKVQLMVATSQPAATVFEESPVPEYMDMPSAEHILGYRLSLPTRLPSGFALKSLELYRPTRNPYQAITYFTSVDDMSVVGLSQYKSPESAPLLVSGKIIRDETIDGTRYVVRESNLSSSQTMVDIHWTDGERNFMLWGNVALDKLLDVARSVKAN